MAGDLAGLTDALNVLGQTGVLRDLDGWHISLAEYDSAEAWDVDPAQWVPLLGAAGARAFYFSRPTAIDLLVDGEIVVVPDLASRDLYSMALRLQQERPVLTESQLARWIWADDVLEMAGVEPFNPLDGRIFSLNQPGSLRSFQTTKSQPVRPTGRYGLSSTSL